MYVKEQRLKMHLSQEALAALCGLSLRTIQRVEGGHRVSYASLRALAVAFDMDVDELELELYAMKKQPDEYTEMPLWMRLGRGKGWFSIPRPEAQKIELFMLVMGLVSLFLSLALPEQASNPLPIPMTPPEVALFGSAGAFLGAYLMSLHIRLGDKYSAWETSGSTRGSTRPGGIFGLFRNRG